MKNQLLSDDTHPTSISSYRKVKIMLIFSVTSLRVLVINKSQSKNEEFRSIKVVACCGDYLRFFLTVNPPIGSG